MTSYLYVLSIGPVQDFIAAARRTRDLWFGSHLLSEISKAAASCIVKNGGILIFPSPQNVDADLAHSSKPDAFNVANIILAELPESCDCDPKEIDRRAQKAACDRWIDYAEKAREFAGDIIRSDVWDEQVSDVLDIISFYSAWVPLGTHYKDTRKRAMRLLSGRKSIRNFSQVEGRPGVPKSSLDGARESTLKEDKELRRKNAIKIKLGEGEQLCAVGLTKRLGGGIVSFPSVSRIALDPWIRGIMASNNPIAKSLLKDIGDKCREKNDFSSKIDDYYSSYQVFPFDGQVLYPFRLRRLLKKTESDTKKYQLLDAWEDQLSNEDLDKLKLIKKKVEQLQNTDESCLGFGQPDPYLAILVADGDYMGRALSNMDSADEHREFSRQLASFAKDARRIVEGFNGCLVYSGGDDVLAFLPVDLSLNAACKLHERFSEIKASKGTPMTLSVGIAIGHFMEPLEDLLKYARDAERAAKGTDRNGLAIHLHMRGGGGPVCLREQWKGNGEGGLNERLNEWAKMHKEGLLPDKAAYDLRLLAKDYEAWSDDESVKQLVEVIPADVKRLLKRKRLSADRKKIPEDKINLFNEINSHEKVSHLAEELVLARKIAVIMRQAEPSSPQERSL